ncbi:MAG: biotin--[acetyl-CoA-carboxylase] ligase [Planctomycetota bacterium]
MIDDDVDPIGRQAVEQLIRDGVCSSVIYPREAGSTSSLALEFLRRGNWSHEDERILFLTDRQTAGRGRHGRSWQSNDQNLAFSIVLAGHDRDSPLNQLTGLAVGVAVAQSIEFELSPLKTRLKWPNDIYVDGGKAAGILLETVANVAGAIVVGVGINVGFSPDLKDDPRSGIVRDLSTSAGRSVHRYELLPTLVQQITDAIGQLPDNLTEIRREFDQRCLLKGHQVSFRHNTDSSESTRHGQCHGIAEFGELKIESENGMELLTSGEAQLLRIVA